MIRGTVINIHFHGALVRLEDGSLASVEAVEVAAHRPQYVRSLERREPLVFVLDRRQRHAVVSLEGRAAGPALSPQGANAVEEREGPRLVDPVFEERIGAYLKQTEAWAPPDRPGPAERHFIRKKRRSALFEARNEPT
jgi:hypothetical protein